MYAKIGGKRFEIRLKSNDNIENGFYFETLDSEIQFRVYKNVEGFILLKIQTIYKIQTFLCALLPIYWDGTVMESFPAQINVCFLAEKIDEFLIIEKMIC